MNRNSLTGPTAFLLACLATICAQVSVRAEVHHFAHHTDLSHEISLAHTPQHIEAAEDAPENAHLGQHSSAVEHLNAAAHTNHHLVIENTHETAHLSLHVHTVEPASETAHESQQLHLVEQHHQVA